MVLLLMVMQTSCKLNRQLKRCTAVPVEAVRTMRYGGKRKSRNTKSGVIAGRKNNFKKAIVQLKKERRLISTAAFDRIRIKNAELQIKRI